MKKMKVHFSSASNEWATPWDLYKRIAERFGPFDLDPCCTDMTAKCKIWITQEQNGLGQSWVVKGQGTRVFMNPPYAREIGKWVQKAFEEVDNGNCEVVVCLIPARTDTIWWHRYCMRAKEICFIKGRVKFEQNGKASTVSAPFPSCIVVFSRYKNLDKLPEISTMNANENC